MVVTEDVIIAKLCRSSRNKGRHERLGYNYRISNINCALRIVQLERIEEMFAKREKVANYIAINQKEIEYLIVLQFEENKEMV